MKPIKLSSKVVVTDPCYTRDTWCMGFLENVKPGLYNPEITHTNQTGGWGERVSQICVIHESVGNIPDSNWEKTDFEVGVDSGQAGIFCDTLYPHGDTTGEYRDKTTFYGTCCDATLGEQDEKVRKWNEEGMKGPRPRCQQGDTVFGKGVVSSSGYGDGGYECFVAKNKEEQIVAIKIVFILDEEDEIEEEELYLDDSEG